MPHAHKLLGGYSDSSDSGDDSNGDLAKRVDPRIALQLADLSNAARDRQTAHDRERDRRVNLTLLNRTRKCNKEGTVEAEKAAANQDRISSWNNFGSQDSTTNLGSIANGQYHREETAKRVQESIRQLRIEGKEIIADSIDEPRGHSAHTHGTQPVRGRGGGVGGSDNRSRMPPSHQSGDARSFLDPALDPGRGQRQSRGSDHKASRGGRAMGRGGHTMQVGRGTLTTQHAISGDLKTSSNTTAGTASSRTGLGGRAAAQRKFQDRPWPPAALMGNVEPPQSKSNGSGLSTVNQPAEIEQRVVDIGTNNLTAPQPVRSVTPVITQSAPLVAQPAPVHFQSPPAEASPHPNKSAPSASTLVKEPISQHFKLADDFSEWYRAATPTVPAPVPTRLQQPVHRPTLSPVVAAGIVQVPRESFVRGANARVQSSDGHRTDGRLSPVSFPGELDISAPSTSPTIAGKLHQDLLDVEIPSDERAALEQSKGQLIRSPVLSSHASLRSNTSQEKSSVAAAIDTANNTLASHAADIAVSSVLAPATSRFLSPPALQDRSPNVAINGGASNSKTSTSSNVFAPSSGPSVGRSSNVSQHTTTSLIGDDTVSHRRANNYQTFAARSVLGNQSNVRRRANEYQTFADRAALGNETTLGSRIAERTTTIPSQTNSLLGDETNIRLRNAKKANTKNSLSDSKYAQEYIPHSTVGAGSAQTGIYRREAGPGLPLLIRDLEAEGLAPVHNRLPSEPAFSRVQTQTNNNSFTQYRDSPYHDITSDDDEL